MNTPPHTLQQAPQGPVLLWFRRDFRLSDHPALTAAVATGRPIVPVYVHDDLSKSYGAAAQLRIEAGLESLDAALRGLGSRLVVRSGDALAQLRAVIADTGAGAVYWSRRYDADGIACDTAVKTALKSDGIDAKSFAGQLLFEPWTVEKNTGGPYQVYTPFWKAVRGRDVGPVLAAPSALRSPDVWPDGLAISDLGLSRAMWRGAEPLRQRISAGTAKAHERMVEFLDGAVSVYGDDRNRLDREGTSGLSDYLAWGEISPRQVWHAAMAAWERGAKGGEQFLKELVWRDFAAYLGYHFPHMFEGNWRSGWDDFPWSKDTQNTDFVAWCRGTTGVEVVDAAMRELWITGRMHNRARMIVASYLTKHLGVHWKLGRDWFADCLIDWDPASNAMGWQWVAGCGPDAAPFFRIFNPDTQADKFDPQRAYRDRWLDLDGSPEAAQILSMSPTEWKDDLQSRPSQPAVSLADGRARALAAYHSLRASG